MKRKHMRVLKGDAWLTAVGKTAFAVLLMSGLVARADRTWDAGAGTTNWQDGANWNPDGTPDAEHVTIDRSGLVIVTLAETNVTIKNLVISAGNAQVTNTLNVGANVTMAGTNLTVGGSNGRGRMNVSGNAALSFGGPLIVGGAGNFDAGDGVLTIRDTASLSVRNMALGIRCVGGTVTQDGGSITIFGPPSSAGNLVLGQTDHSSTTLGESNCTGIFTLNAGVLTVNGQLQAGFAARVLTATIQPDGVGVFTQNGGEARVGSPSISGNMAGSLQLASGGGGVSGRSFGTYKLHGGTLTINCGGVNIPGTEVSIGCFANGSNTYSGAGLFEFGNSNGTAVFQQFGGLTNTAKGITVRRYAAVDGAFVGHGDVLFSGVLFNNGQVIADGYGAVRTLDMSHFSRITNSIENDAVTPGTDEINGWYARNKGTLLLPLLNVPLTNGAIVNWGESTGDADIDLVNSLRLAVSNVTTAGKIKVSLLAPDLDEGAGGTFAGMWKVEAVSNLVFGTVNLTARYDHQRAAALGLPEADLRLYVKKGDKWKDVTGGPVDTASRRIQSSTLSAVGTFAVGQARHASGAVLLVR